MTQWQNTNYRTEYFIYELQNTTLVNILSLDPFKSVIDGFSILPTERHDLQTQNLFLEKKNNNLQIN